MSGDGSPGRTGANTAGGRVLSVLYRGAQGAGAGVRISSCSSSACDSLGLAGLFFEGPITISSQKIINFFPKKPHGYIQLGTYQNTYGSRITHTYPNMESVSNVTHAYVTHTL